MRPRHIRARFAFATLAAIVFSFACAGEPSGNVLVNADIIGMTGAKISPMIIVNRIYSTPNNFDLSDQAFMQLKEVGVADEVLSAMLAASKGEGVAAVLNSAVGAGGSFSQQSGLGNLPSLAPPPLGGDVTSMPSPFGDTGFSLPPSLSDMSLPDLPPAPTAPGITQPLAATNNDDNFFSAMPGMVSDRAPAPGNLTPPPVSTLPSRLQPPAPTGTQTAGALSPIPQTPALTQTTPGQLFSQIESPASAPAATAAGDGLDTQRFERELLNIVQGTPEGRRSGLAWMVANQQQTLPVLRQALGINKPELQSAAIQALGLFEDTQSLPQIRDLLGSPDQAVRQQAAETLARMNDSPAIDMAEQSLTSNINPLDGLIRLVGYARLVRASDNLATLLSTSQSSLNRAAAAAALAEIGPAGSVAWPAIEKALTSDGDAIVRREAARAVAAFHDPSSARLLQSACRKDPEVRKITLQVMADYPESVGFLVGVMRLGSDQIAPDETETARASLAKLTGQDFGLDGSRWQSWYADNRSRFGSTPAPVLASTPGAAASGRITAPAGAGTAATGKSVDITALGIVVDPSEIPMAPEVDSGYRPGTGAGQGAGSGILRIPGMGDGMAGLPGPASPRDFDDGATQNTGGFGASAMDMPPAPGAMSDAAFGGMGGGGMSGGGMGGGGFGGGFGGGGMSDGVEEQMWGGSMPGTGMSSSGAGGIGGAGAAAAAPAAPAPAPTVSPPPGLASQESSLPPGGLRLALPPITSGSEYDDGPPMLGAGASYGGLSDPATETTSDFSSPGFGMDAPGDMTAYDSFSVPMDSGVTTLYETPPSYSGFDGSSYGDPASSYSMGDPDVTRTLDQSYSIPDMYTDSVSSEGLMDTGSLIGYEATPITPVVSDMGSTGTMLPMPGTTTDAPATISFPGDTTTFGLGEPMFAEDGPTASYESSAPLSGSLVMPPPPGGLASGSTGYDTQYMDEYDGTLGEQILTPSAESVDGLLHGQTYSISIPNEYVPGSAIESDLLQGVVPSETAQVEVYSSSPPVEYEEADTGDTYSSAPILTPGAPGTLAGFYSESTLSMDEEEEEAEAYTTTLPVPGYVTESTDTRYDDFSSLPTLDIDHYSPAPSIGLSEEDARVASEAYTSAPPLTGIVTGVPLQDNEEEGTTMEWVRGVGLVERQGGAPIRGADSAESEAVDFFPDDGTYVEAIGSGDIFGASSMPPVSGGIIISPPGSEGPFLLGDDLLNSTEATVISPAERSPVPTGGRPSRMLRKQR